MSAPEIPVERKTAYLPQHPQANAGRGGATGMVSRGGMMMTAGRGASSAAFAARGGTRPLPGMKPATAAATAAQKQATSAAPPQQEAVAMEESGPTVIEKEISGPGAFSWSDYQTTFQPGRKPTGKTYELKLASEEVVGVWLRNLRVNFGIQENKFQKGNYQVVPGLSYKYTPEALRWAKEAQQFYVDQIRLHIEEINDDLGLVDKKRWRADEVVAEEDDRKIFVKPLYNFPKETAKDDIYYDWEYIAPAAGTDPQQQGVPFDHGDAAPPASGDVQPMDQAAAEGGAPVEDGSLPMPPAEPAPTSTLRLERFDQKGNFLEPFRNFKIDLPRNLKNFRFEVLKPGSKDVFDAKRVPMDFYLSTKRPCDIFYIIDGCYIDMATKKVTIKGYTNFVQVGEGRDSQVGGRSVKGRTAPPSEESGTLDASGRVADPRNAKRARFA